MSLYGPCGNCWHSHGGVSPTSVCPECDCIHYREASLADVPEELRQLREELVSAQTRIEALTERERALRDALEYTIATIENVLPTMREFGVDEETEGAEERLEEIRKLLRPEGP